MAELPTQDELIGSIRDRLPQLLRSDPSLRDYVLGVVHEKFPDKEMVEDRFTRMLNELARSREEQARKWDEQNRKWEEQNRKWEKSDRRFDAMLEELRRDREQTSRRFDAMEAKHERSIGALGARWGTQSERAFRDALAGILTRSFDVDVVNVNEFDDEGEVFGRPDQVELDIIIKNGLLIACELKSSVDKPAMYGFERKVRFYEKRHHRRASRMIVVSPMIEERARRVGEKLGIEMYPDSPNVPVYTSSG